MSGTDFDFDEFMAFAQRLEPNGRALQASYFSWIRAFEATPEADRNYTTISPALALEYMRLLFSHEVLVEDGRQLARNQNMVERLENEGFTPKAANEKFPMDLAIGRLSEFDSWFFYKRNIHPRDLSTRVFRYTFVKMIADDALRDDTAIIAYLRRNSLTQYAVPELCR